MIYRVKAKILQQMLYFLYIGAYAQKMDQNGGKYLSCLKRGTERGEVLTWAL